MSAITSISNVTCSGIILKQHIRPNTLKGKTIALGRRLTQRQTSTLRVFLQLFN